MIAEENFDNLGLRSGRRLADQTLTENPILYLDGVSKSFRIGKHHNGRANVGSDYHQVLNGIDLKIFEGEFVTVIGSSGSGKSTLLNLIAGLEIPNSGRVVVGTGRKESTAKRIMVFQEGALFPWLSVWENVEFGLMINNVPEQRRKSQVQRYVSLVGLGDFSDFFVHQLSGGMKQRVAIARALAMDPDILLMDEPFAALDVQTRDLLNDELVGIHKTTGKTIVFVTHNINEAILLGDRVIILSASQKNILRQFTIAQPRPRNLEDDTLFEIKRQILHEFEGDLIASRRG